VLSHLFPQKRRTTAAQAPASSVAPNDSRPRDHAAEISLLLDTVGSLLQVYGRNAFDTDARPADQVRAELLAWKRHVTMGAARPGSEQAQAALSVGDRDWKGLLQAFAEIRASEGKSVVRTTDDMRAIIWAFVSAAHQVIVDEREDSRVAEQQFERVRGAVQSGNAEQLKAEALAVVGTLEEMMRQRREKQHAQFTALGEKLRHLAQELEDARRESAIDGLTGLANRKSLDEYLPRCLELHTLLGQPACLLLVDVDNFKKVNDTHGHPVGDLVLKQIALAMAKTFLRRVDFVCRYGGDEFVVVLREASLENGLALAEKLRRVVAELRTTELAEAMGPQPEHAALVSVSVGVATLGAGDTATSWIKRADEALYAAKRAGRDCVMGRQPGHR
jgi:diguanylate cyclase (GGDEF)-like protein